ncbi:hypothetical protein DB41_FW00020, partial [Neochlamydia sp. TUME1]|uniref:tetratricopeptide repeat protein n=1 Tax=Neochlamydia sp. TUME1 TaxID=1478174 RepID=UPI000583B9D9
MNLESLNTHPLIFPDFNKVENNSISPLRDTSAYAEIALKIFKKLKLLDLCQAKFVCKEWKQLIKSSFLDEEEAYTQALKRAIQNEDVIKEAFCIEKLGDLYAKKETSETLLQAAGLYNYALRRSSAGQQKSIKEELLKVEISLSKACKGEPVSIPKTKEQFEKNREVLKKFRDEIEEKIQALGLDPSPKEVRELYSEIAQHIKIFFKRLAIQVFDTLGPTPCEYAMIGFGSLAREEMTPYSDLEFGILMQEDTGENREYFKCFTTLLHLKVINLGETILPALNIPCIKEVNLFDSVTPRGFAFDGEGVQGKGCKTPFGNRQTFELIQTPEKMAQYIAKDEKGQWWHEKETHLPMELLNFTHLLGNLELTHGYKQKIQKLLDNPYKTGLNLRQYLAKQHLVQEDMSAFDPGMRDIEKHGMLIKVKNDLYCFPHLALDRLALLKEIKASDTFTRIDQLNKQETIRDSAAEKLKEWMSIVLFMRLKTYSHYQAQQEMMNPLIKPFGFEDPQLIENQFALDHEALAKVKKIYRIFMPFHEALQEFLAGDEKKLKSSSLNDNSPQAQAEIALRLFQYKEAKKWYRKALKEKQTNSEVLNALGCIYEREGKLEKAVYYINQALSINLARVGENHSNVAANYNNLGAIYQKQGNLEKAAEYSQKALAIRRELYGEHHSEIASFYSNLGAIYQEQDKLEFAAKYVHQALSINLKLVGETHSDVSINYNNLGVIYHKQRNLEKAVEYLRKALAINLKLYGEYHPVVANCYNSLGMIYKNQGNLDKAFEYAHKALAINCKLLGKNHPSVAENYYSLGQIYKKQGNLEQATEYIEKSHTINLEQFGENHPNVAIDYHNLGQIYQEQGKLTQALKYTEKALFINVKQFGENHSTIL